jgi:hypothetical protein
MTRFRRCHYAIVATAIATPAAAFALGLFCRSTHSGGRLVAGSAAVGSQHDEAPAPRLIDLPYDVRPVAALFDGPPLPGQSDDEPPAQLESSPAQWPSFDGQPIKRFPAIDELQGDENLPLDEAFPKIDSGDERRPAIAVESDRLPAVSDEDAAIPTFKLTPSQRFPPAASSLEQARFDPAFDRAMGAVSQQADQRIAAGFRLATKGALYSARSEMIQALRLIAQALDAQSRTREHSQRLAEGLRTLKEAADFAPRGARLEGDLDLAAVVATHRTRVLDDRLDGLTALAARQAYYTHAQEQLAEAVRLAPSASNALYGLGRIHQALADDDPESADLNQPAAMVCHQAALLVEPRNYLAANELGVLLARAGQLEDSRRLFLLSLRSHRQRATWKNLAAVEAMRGDHDLARRAEHEAQLLAGVSPTSSTSRGVQWVDPSEFIRQNEAAPASGKPVGSAPRVPKLR